MNGQTCRYAGVGLLLALMPLAGCHKQATVAGPIRPVRWLAVHAASAADANSYAGVVRARYESSLGFRVGGKITRRDVDVGDRVRAGQELARLDSSDLTLQVRSNRAEIAARQADYDMAKADLDRYKDLVGPGYVSRSEYDRQRSAYQSAKAQLDAARAQYRQSVNQSDYSRLLADHDGVITAILAEAGQVVSAGQTVMQIARSGNVEIDTSVPEDVIAQLKVGQTAKVVLGGAANSVIPGSIREIASSADPATRTYDVRVRIPKPPPDMRLGMTATVNIPSVAESGMPAVFRLPLTAVTDCGSARCVWVIDPKQSTVHRQQISIVGVADNDLLVGTGLADGDIVVTAGANLLLPGQKVRRLSIAESADAG